MARRLSTRRGGSGSAIPTRRSPTDRRRLHRAAPQCYRLYPDAHATVDTLRGAGVRLALVTNGASAMQRDKIVRSTSAIASITSDRRRVRPRQARARRLSPRTRPPGGGRRRLDGRRQLPNGKSWRRSSSACAASGTTPTRLACRPTRRRSRAASSAGWGAAGVTFISRPSSGGEVARSGAVAAPLVGGEGLRRLRSFAGSDIGSRSTSPVAFPSAPYGGTSPMTGTFTIIGARSSGSLSAVQHQALDPAALDQVLLSTSSMSSLVGQGVPDALDRSPKSARARSGRGNRHC